jgi:cytochrome c oxidase subunit 2
MLLGVEVRSQESFESWVIEQTAPLVDPTDELAISGHAMFLELSCQNCHPLGDEAVGTFAPDLTHLMSRERFASGLVPNTEENLRAWLVDPQNVKPGCNMPSLKLSDTQLDAVVAYLVTLK